jgi:hypothetical protein
MPGNEAVQNAREGGIEHSGSKWGVGQMDAVYTAGQLVMCTASNKVFSSPYT